MAAQYRIVSSYRSGRRLRFPREADSRGADGEEKKIRGGHVVAAARRCRELPSIRKRPDRRDYVTRVARSPWRGRAAVLRARKLREIATIAAISCHATSRVARGKTEKLNRVAPLLKIGVVQE